MPGWPWYVQSRIAAEEAGRLEREPAAGYRHHRPVLRAREMRRPEGVPQDNVGAVDVAVTGRERGQAGAARMLVDEITRRVALRRVVPGDPQVVRGEPGAPGDRRRRIGQEGGRGFGVERVADWLAELVRPLGADHPPGPPTGRICSPGALRLHAEPGHLLHDRV